MINWSRQVASVTLFSLRTLPERKGSAVTAAVGIAGVVGVFVAVLSIAEGVRAVMSDEGPQDRVVVLRAGAYNEMSSGLARDQATLIAQSAGVARQGDAPLASAELFVMINLPKRGVGTDSNVPMRGVSKAALDVRGNVEFVEGRLFTPGKNEVIVGTGAARSYDGLEVGQSIRIGKNDWAVVGVFRGGDGTSESEVWTDATVLQSAYQRDGFQSVHVRLESPESLGAFKASLKSDPRLEVDAKLLGEYLSENSTNLRLFIERVGVSIAVLMGLGALFGAMNTMYSAVAARSREIATLRALGFGAGPVVLSVLFESILLALIGGAVGAGAAYALFDGFQAATMNFDTFSQIAFSFRVTPALLLTATLWAVAIGLLGGLFPAVRAARLPIAAALRET